MRVENPFLNSPVRDETQRLYDLSKFDGETVLISRLVQNEELSYHDKLKLQTLVYNEKNNDFVVLFTQFLETYTRKQGGQSILKESSYSFLRDMMFRIMVRRLSESKDWALVFSLVYAFQFLRYEVGGSIVSAKNDLSNDEVFQKDDFWLAAFYAIFSGYKNKGSQSPALKELLMLNFASLRSLRRSKTAAIEVMKRTMSLNFGFSLEFILDESENKGVSRSDLVFYREADLDAKKAHKIF